MIFLYWDGRRMRLDKNENIGGGEIVICRHRMIKSIVYVYILIKVQGILELLVIANITSILCAYCIIITQKMIFYIFLNEYRESVCAFLLIMGGVFLNVVSRLNRMVFEKDTVLGISCWYESLFIVAILLAVNIYIQKQFESRSFSRLQNFCVYLPRFLGFGVV